MARSDAQRRNSVVLFGSICTAALALAPIVARAAEISAQPVVATSHAVIDLANPTATPGPDRVGVALDAVIDLSAEALSSQGVPAPRLVTPPALLGTPSPTPVAAWLALDDIAGGSGLVAPPGAQGAAGTSWLMVTLGNDYRIQDKATGAAISTVTTSSFWAATGATNPVGSRVWYDPYAARFVIAASSDAQTAASSILVALSQTSDPTGAWDLWRFDVDAADQLWSDFPMLGVNENWVAVAFNAWTVGTNYFQEGRILVLDYPQLQASTAAATTFTGITSADGGFYMHPALTYSATEPTLYVVSHLNSTDATYKLSTITGTPAAPVLTIGTTQTNPLGAWTAVFGEALPQASEPGPGTGVRKIRVDDAYPRGHVTFRNGQIWFTQTVGLGAGASLHTGVQWSSLDTSGAYLEGGRVEDPAATATSGDWYAFGSLAVNKDGDALLGFTSFSATAWPSAGYVYRKVGDAAGTMRDPYVFRTGSDYYDYPAGAPAGNRWGYYSATVIDPTNDLEFWTIQEASDPRVGTGSGSGRWTTWWAHVAPAVAIVAPPGSTGSLRDASQAPLTLTKQPGGDVRLDWGSACMSSWPDFVVYEGTLGDFTSHQSRLCSTGGAPTATLAPDAGSRFYLVGARALDREGPASISSDGTPFPPAAVTCAPPVQGMCP